MGLCDILYAYMIFCDILMCDILYVCDILNLLLVCIVALSPFSHSDTEIDWEKQLWQCWLETPM